MYEHDDLNDEIEEIRELMYDLLKDFPTGATSKLLEEQYEKKYVHTGIGRPLPVHWLHYVQQADEFEVKQLSTVTMLYLVNAESLAPLGSSLSTFVISNNDSSSVNTTDDLIDKTIHNDEFENYENLNLRDKVDNGESQETLQPTNTAEYKIDSMALLTMPTDVTIQAHVVFATDPDNIFVRLCSWDPVPDYLYSALMRVSDTQHDPPPSSKIVPGQHFAAFINGIWERVRIIRKSEKFSSHWIVFVIDVGFYHIVGQSDLRPFSDAVKAFTKIFLARVKLSGIAPLENISTPPPVNGSRTYTAAKNESVKWSRDAQNLIAAELTPRSTSSTPKKVELFPDKEWAIDAEFKIPVTNARIISDGIDFAEKLISSGFATKKKI